MAICSRSRAGSGWLLATSLLLAACDSAPRAHTAADAASLRAALGTNPAVWLNYFDSTGQGDWRRIIP